MFFLAFTGTNSGACSTERFKKYIDLASRGYIVEKLDIKYNKNNTDATQQ